MVGCDAEDGGGMLVKCWVRELASGCMQPCWRGYEPAITVDMGCRTIIRRGSVGPVVGTGVLTT